MGTCRSSAVQVIPERDVMVSVVDAIVAFEETMKRGEPMTRSQHKERHALEPVTRELKRLQQKGRVPTASLDLNR
jgi:hypothetical protein